MSLDPSDLAVDTFATAELPGSDIPTQRTFERDCTVPWLCPDTM